MTSWKKRRTQVRKQITNARNEIDGIFSSQSSRGAVKGLVEQLQQLHRESSKIHTEITSNEEDGTKNDKQEAINLRYIQNSGETFDRVQTYLNYRLNDPASEVDLEDP
jgi:hypothetical protein